MAAKIMVTSEVMGFMAKLRVAMMSRGAVGDNAVHWRYGFWAKLQDGSTGSSPLCQEFNSVFACNCFEIR